MLLTGIWISFTKNPMNPMIQNPIPVAIAILRNSVYVVCRFIVVVDFSFRASKYITKNLPFFPGFSHLLINIWLSFAKSSKGSKTILLRLDILIYKTSSQQKYFPNLVVVWFLAKRMVGWGLSITSALSMYNAQRNKGTVIIIIIKNECEVETRGIDKITGWDRFVDSERGYRAWWG